MSTRASIIYKPERGIHIYEELLDGTVCLEAERDGSTINVLLMKVDEWIDLGLPTRPNKGHNPRFIYELVRACKTLLYAYAAHKDNFDVQLFLPVLREMSEALEKMGELVIVRDIKEADDGR